MSKLKDQTFSLSKGQIYRAKLNKTRKEKLGNENMTLYRVYIFLMIKYKIEKEIQFMNFFLLPYIVHLLV